MKNLILVIILTVGYAQARRVPSPECFSLASNPPRLTDAKINIGWNRQIEAIGGIAGAGGNTAPLMQMLQNQLSMEMQNLRDSHKAKLKAMGCH